MPKILVNGIHLYYFNQCHTASVIRGKGGGEKIFG